MLRSPDSPDAPGLAFRVLPGGIKTMGRAERTDFRVDVPLVSRVHCRLTSAGPGELEVEDLKSTNGTFVNDRRIKQAALVPGDRLRLGRVEFVVERAESATAPAGMDSCDAPYQSMSRGRVPETRARRRRTRTTPDGSNR